MGKAEEKDFQSRIARIDQLVSAVDEIDDPNAQAKVKELVQLLLDLHGIGLERMLDVTYDAGAAGQAIIDDLARDDLVSALLLLHGLHPYDLQTRVVQALEKVRPYMKSHGGGVELLGVTDDGIVRLRLEGSCHGCASSRVTLKYAVEEVIYAAAPDAAGIETEGTLEEQPAPAAGFIPMSQLMSIPIAPPVDHAGGWVDVEGLASLRSLTEGATCVMQVQGIPVLFCRAGSLYAYGYACPHCNQSLEQATLQQERLVCPACGHAFDVVHAGRDLTEPTLHLNPFPLLEERGQVRVALPAMAAEVGMR